MDGNNGKSNDLSREEDYRDYEERDVDSGWPYSDGAGAASKDPANREYGGTAANFDRDTNGGFRTIDVDADGNQEPLADSLTPETEGRENADDLEERVTDALSGLKDLDMDSIEVQAHGHRIVLEGSVDDLTLSRQAERCAQAVSGVRDVVNKLQLLGADTHIPTDD